jgi:hypothetical protein
MIARPTPLALSFGRALLLANEGPDAIVVQPGGQSPIFEPAAASPVAGASPAKCGR